MGGGKRLLRITRYLRAASSSAWRGRGGFRARGGQRGSRGAATQSAEPSGRCARGRSAAHRASSPRTVLPPPGAGQRYRPPRPPAGATWASPAQSVRQHGGGRVMTYQTGHSWPQPDGAGIGSWALTLPRSVRGYGGRCGVGWLVAGRHEGRWHWIPWRRADDPLASQGCGCLLCVRVRLLRGQRRDWFVEGGLGRSGSGWARRASKPPNLVQHERAHIEERGQVCVRKVCEQLEAGVRR